VPVSNAIAVNIAAMVMRMSRRRQYTGFWRRVTLPTLALWPRARTDTANTPVTIERRITWHGGADFSGASRCRAGLRHAVGVPLPWHALNVVA
jgi:hypothetical protein